MGARRRTAVLVSAGAVAAALLTGCTDAQGTDGKNYISGDGLVTVIDAADRGEPVAVAGSTLDGAHLDLGDLRGSVVVVNMWGAWCGECRQEMPTLVAAVAELPAGTQTVGIDIRDLGRDNPLAFERTYGITYPSIYDPGSETLLRFPAPYSPRETPSTMVLDRQGRLAALIRGVLPSKGTLIDVVEGVATEDG